MSPPPPRLPTTPLSAKLLIAISSILLTHSCYSAHEHTTTHSTLTLNPHPSSLPLDIVLETIISVSLLCVGIVLAGWELKPISWRIWAGQQERETGQGPYSFLESRLGFVDIRSKRNDFGKWVKGREASHS